LSRQFLDALPFHHDNQLQSWVFAELVQNRAAAPSRSVISLRSYLYAGGGMSLLARTLRLGYVLTLSLIVLLLLNPRPSQGQFRGHILPGAPLIAPAHRFPRGVGFGGFGGVGGFPAFGFRGFGFAGVPVVSFLPVPVVTGPVVAVPAFGFAGFNGIGAFGFTGFGGGFGVGGFGFNGFGFSGFGFNGFAFNGFSAFDVGLAFPGGAINIGVAGGSGFGGFGGFAGKGFGGFNGGNGL
jgi:hypothetical protein